MKVAVIGAGPAGLIAARTLSSEGIDYDVFEANDEVGGTWIYTDHLLDRHGRPVNTSMYKSLKTNLPKEVMLFEGLDYEVKGVSYLEASQVLNYLKQFAEKFSINDHIKFEHLVVNVSWKGSSWELIATDLNSRKEKTYNYDAIFVCNGHYSVPSYPEIPGLETFTGTTMHSHYYRVPEVFNDKIVLLMGCGASGVEIMFDLCPFVKKLYFSHHGPEFFKEQVKNEKIIQKTDIMKITDSNIHFMDDTIEQVDVILFCTGYHFDFKFLDESCGIDVDNGYVNPLYKQMVSIPHNSMMFIGIPFQTIVFQLFELQAKSAVNILTKKVKLPEKEDMKKDTEKWEEMLLSKGTQKNKFHIICEYLREYVHDIIKLGNLPPFPKVLFDIYDVSKTTRQKSLSTYRNHVFRINTFVLDDCK